MNSAPASVLRGHTTLHSHEGVVTAANEHEHTRATGSETAPRYDARLQDGLPADLPPSIPTLSLRDLPNELWCDVWWYLPLRDRVSVAQVCGKWRALALCTPSLWTRLDYYATRHAHFCACPECCRDRPLAVRHESGWIDSPYPPNASNERLIGAVLGRSGDLALHLTLHIVPFACDALTLTSLAVTLQRAGGRIAHISAVAPNVRPVAHIFLHFSCLPALRTLSLSDAPGCQCSVQHDLGARQSDFVAKEIDVPRLAVLDMRASSPVLWPSGSYLYLPALLSLGLHTRRMRDVVAALRASPALTLLHVKLADFPPDPYQATSIEEVRDALASVRVCRVEGIRVADEDWLLAAFSSAGRRSLVLRYLEFPARGFGILRAPESSPFRLAVSPDEEMVSITTQTGARSRQLVFPLELADESDTDSTPAQDEFWGIWENARVVDGVRSVSSDDKMWAAFVDARILSS